MVDGACGAGRQAKWRRFSEMSEPHCGTTRLLGRSHALPRLQQKGRFGGYALSDRIDHWNPQSPGYHRLGCCAGWKPRHLPKTTAQLLRKKLHYICDATSDVLERDLLAVRLTCSLLYVVLTALAHGHGRRD